MPESENTVSKKELHYCPDCNTPIEDVTRIKSTGNGVAYATIQCAECSFVGQEVWEHTKTVRVERNNQ